MNLHELHFQDGYFLGTHDAISQQYCINIERSTLNECNEAPLRYEETILKGLP